MNISVEFDGDVIAEALAQVLEEEANVEGGQAKGLREYIKDGTSNYDTRWAIDLMVDASKKALEVG